MELRTNDFFLTNHEMERCDMKQTDNYSEKTVKDFLNFRFIFIFFIFQISLVDIVESYKSFKT